MINSRQDLHSYLEADRIALGRKSVLRSLFLIDPIWACLRMLRRVEYHLNCSTGLLWKVHLTILRSRLKIMQLILGFTIPPNTVGPGLNLPHHGTIVIHNNARIGANARINIGVVIGENNGSDMVPSIGNDVVIEAGVKIFGKIFIADGIHIGANAVVNKSFTDPNVVLAGVPARVIKTQVQCHGF